MKERPILFSAPMVRALLDGSKTQTRCIVKPQPPDDISLTADLYYPVSRVRNGEASHGDEVFGASSLDGEWAVKCPYGQPGDRLWVREAWCMATPLMGIGEWPTYRATCHELDERHLKWKPSIHMPRAISRIQLKIVSVRVERLDDISQEDAEAEGVKCNMSALTFRDHYAKLWESINGAGSWAVNPWVWCVEFRMAQP